MASLDKLNVILPESEFEIREQTSELKVSPRHYALNEENPEALGHIMTTKDGRKLSGSKIYANTDRVGITIKRLPTGTVSMLISTNPNKWHHPWQTSTDPEQYREFRHGLEAEIESIGISCNLPAAKLSRVDLARQRHLTHPLQSYHRVFDCIRARRQPSATYGDTFRVGNKQRQAIIYDKQKEANLEFDIDCHNLIRFETRFSTHRSATKYTGLRLLRDLDSDIESNGFENLSHVYSSYLETEIFANLDKKATPAPSIRDHLEQLIEQSPKRVIERLFMESGIFSVMQRSGGSHALAELTASMLDFNSEESRSRYYRRVRSGIEHHFSAALSRRAPESENLGDLFDELMSFSKHEPTPISKTA